MASSSSNQHEHSARDVVALMGVNCWSRSSYQIALRLHERGEWPAYLAAAELPWVTKALESHELWDRFISPRSEQWRFHAPPPPIFDMPPTPAHDTTQKRSPSDIAALTYSGKRIARQDNDSGNNTHQLRAGKRARAITAASMDSDDDMLSVLSGSDIDMAMWANDASVTPNPVSPGSASTDAIHAKSASDNTPTDATSDLASAEGSLVCALAAFHARAAIFEQYVPVLCGTRDCTKCTDVAVALDDVAAAHVKLAANNSADADADADEAMDVEVPSLVDAKMPEPLLSRNIDEDEEYDDDDDGDVHMADNDKHVPQKAEPSTAAPSQSTNGTLVTGIVVATSQPVHSQDQSVSNALPNGIVKDSI
ncbi:hypothetical protein IWW38_005201, partial [Coemansia aciculifera]